MKIKSIFRMVLVILVVMDNITNIGVTYLTYSYEEIGILVAIKKEDQKMIKKFWKKYKGKKDIPLDEINGYPFIYDESQESLKIDFTTEKNYPIKELTLFK